MRTLVAGIVVCLTALGCADSAAGQTTQSAPAAVDHSAFDRILRENVRDERVDYLNIRSRHWRELCGYLDELALVDAEQLPRDARLAYYINLYNATMIDAVIRRFHAGYSPEDDDFAVFKEPLVRLKDREISLNDLENKIIRPMLKDPRVHVALVCGAQSCPPLAPRAYEADGLDIVLEESMKRFLNDESRNRVGSNGEPPKLSRIFEWYAEDFGGRKALEDYVSRYAESKPKSGKIEFLNYSWRLNIAAPRDGQWVVVKSPEKLRDKPNDIVMVGDAKAGDVFRVLGKDAGWIRVERPLGAGEAWLPDKSVDPFKINGE